MEHDRGKSREPAPTARHMAGGRPVLKVSQACLDCGYELMGLPLNGSCPECGQAIEHSLRAIPRSDRSALETRRGLKYINAGWLGMTILLLGCVRLDLSMIVCIIASVFRCIGYLMIRRSHRGSPREGIGWLGWHG